MRERRRSARRREEGTPVDLPGRALPQRVDDRMTAAGQGFRAQRLHQRVRGRVTDAGQGEKTPSASRFGFRIE